MRRQILMIVTSHKQLGNTGRMTGLWAEELAIPYYAFLDAGAEVHLASPQGGAAPIDPASLKPQGENPPIVARMLADETLMSQLAHTQKTAAVQAADYDAVFFPGGHGAMWDLPQDAGTQQAIESFYAQGKIIGSVCHGAAGLVAAQKPDGTPLVQGLKVNAFTDAEEAAVQLTAVVPFQLESRLRELGGLFQAGANWQSFAVRDGQLITGQNPQSSAQVATQMLAALGMVAE